ncbi:MAG: hypothetical protein DMG12_15595 [Acidobacteria bacterium]|nr:MAG: hypothetical protein DMG12_15595 [Acidobacteriota bacterium]
MISLYLFSSFLFVQVQPKPLPELKPFLAELRKTLHTDRHLLSQYTYTEKQTLMQLDSKGAPKTTEVNAFEVFPGSSERVGYRRRIVRDGVPLTPAELKKEDQQVEKRVEAAEHRRSRITPPERERNRVDRLRREEQIIDDALGVFDVEMAGRETIGGRPAILLNFWPRAAYKPKTSEGKNMQHVAGRAWIDEEDYQVARVEAEVIDPISIGLGILAKLQKGASIVADRRKFNDEIWLPMRTEITLNGRVLLVKGFNIRWINEYSEQKKYTVDTILKFSDVEDPQP